MACGAGATDFILFVQSTLLDWLATFVDASRARFANTQLFTGRNTTRFEALCALRLRGLIRAASDLLHAFSTQIRVVGFADTHLFAVVGTNRVPSNTIGTLCLDHGVVGAFHNRFTGISHSGVSR